MKILLIGKFPPIEGGVSGYTFWLAHGLARHGHSVHVVTNANEVEPTLKQFHYGFDGDWLSGLDESNAFHVYQTTPLLNGSYIPFAEPFVTKLFGLALSVIEQHDCDLIFSWYFEPYGMVGALVAYATDRPFVVRHAGSDLGRLACHPELSSAYRWALNRASALMVANESELKNRFGVIDRPRIPLARPRLPDVFFSTQDPLDTKELLKVSGEWFSQSGLPDNLIKKIRRVNQKTIPDDVFTLGLYGKVGITKGSFDLLEALAQLSAIGNKFAFFTMSCGRREMLQRYYEFIVNSPLLAKRTWIFPPLAPWRIPEFLHCCDAVCCLEREFFIPFHGPLIPQEILASGACLVCSKEIALKPIYCGNLVDNRNAVIVADPKDHVKLAGKIGNLIGDRERTRSIGLQGRKLAKFFDDDLLSFDASIKKFATHLKCLISSKNGKSSNN